jgi:aspartyl-tRNA(Asn)/glutamyl-tRNA(Gln) amidotransferase subunit A
VTGNALHELGLTEAAARIRDRRLSPVEYLRAFRDRAAALEPRLNAFIRPLWDAAEQQARAAEKDIAKNGPRSPLHGLPVGLKDIIDLAGHPTTCHSKILLDNVKREDAVVVARLRAA